MIHSHIQQKGAMLVTIIIISAIGIAVTVGFVAWAVTSSQAVKQMTYKEQAFQIAEAGIEYYRWHLAHAPEDYHDGTDGPGPYVHDFTDKDGNVIGTFALTIDPPPLGTRVVTITSTGTVAEAPKTSRTIRAQLAIPSLAQFAVAANEEMRFGEGTEVFGPIHANGGIRFDGYAHNIITSARETYDDPDHSGQKEHAVHTHVSPTDPLPPTPAPQRTDVFGAGRQYPVPQVDFTGLTNNLADIKSAAQDDGHYFADSGAVGYHMVLHTNDTFTLYRVTSQQSGGFGCQGASNRWATWSIGNETYLGTYDNPANGAVFFEDDVWVDGQIDTARLTIAAGRFPDVPPKRKSIIVNEDLLYSNYDGSDVIGLIAQADVNVGLYSEDELRIDAALVAQNGRVGRHYYNAPSWFSNRCGPHHTRQSITNYGMIATNNRYGFAYTDGTGYQERDLIYDNNLLYGPPPLFPLTSDQYEIIYWEEVE